MKNTKSPVMVAPNGLNLTRSILRPNSRLNRVRDYLYVFGPSTKERILREVFEKKIVPHVSSRGFSIIVNEVSRGWGAYLFILAINHGYIRKVRTGNTVTYHFVA